MSTPCENCGSHIRVCANCDFYKGKYIEIPDNASNGDILKIMFPNEEIYKGGFGYDLGDVRTIDFEWWDAPYQKGTK